MTDAQPRGLSISIYKPDRGLGILKDDQVANLGTRLDAYTHTIDAMGGFKSANLTIRIQQNEFEQFIRWIGYHVEVEDFSNFRVFEGFVNRIIVQMAGLIVEIGPLLDIANRVALEYSTVDTTVQPPAVGVRALTAYTNDATSQGLYGTIEKVLSSGGVTAANAIKLRDMFLVESSIPTLSLSFSGGSAISQVQLEILGYVNLFRTYTYNYTALSGTQNADAKITAVVGASPNSYFDDSGIAANTYQVERWENDNNDAWSVIRKVTEYGDASDQRWLFGVYEDRLVRYYQIEDTEPLYFQDLRDPQQRLMNNVGNWVPPWRMRPGHFLRYGGIFAGELPSGGFTSMFADPYVEFVETVTYTMPYQLQHSGSRYSKLAQRIAKLGLAGIGA